MSIKIKNPKDREEIFEQLDEIEEEKKEIQEQLWLDEEYFIYPDLFDDWDIEMENDYRNKVEKDFEDYNSMDYAWFWEY